MTSSNDNPNIEVYIPHRVQLHITFYFPPVYCSLSNAIYFYIVCLIILFPVPASQPTSCSTVRLLCFLLGLQVRACMEEVE